MMEPQYLTPELIAYLEQKAKDPIWQMGVLAAGYKNWYGILRVSPVGLIHFYGNIHTGWQHVISRHAYYSNEVYFGDGAKGNPSKFTSIGVPIFDWTQIADDVYRTGEIDTKEHPDAAMFVKYTGKSSRFTGSNGESKDFVVILYRGTKIVHSIFPKKDLQGGLPKTKLKEFKRALNLVTAEKQLFGDWMTIRIPYIDAKNVERYVIIIYTDTNTMHSKAHLQINWPNGQPRYSIHTLQIFDIRLNKADVEAGNLEFTRFLNTFTKFGDFSHIEEVIERTERILFTPNNETK